MKKLIYIITFLLILNIAFAEESIYDYIKKAKQNPSNYEYVLSPILSGPENAVMTRFNKEMRIHKSRMDSEVGDEIKNYIIIGNSKINKVTKRLIGEWTFKEGEGIIKVKDGNLIIAGTVQKVTTNLLEIIVDYEKNKKILSKDEYIIGKSRLEKEDKATETSAEPTEKPAMETSSFTLWIIIGAILLGAGLSLFLIKKRKTEPVQQQMPPNLVPLQNYIQQNLSKGYPKEQIEQTLAKQGWPQQTLDFIFNNMNK